jgi:hypothetical protein
MRRWWIAVVGGAALALGLAPSEPSRGAGPFSFPHQPHISDALIEAGLRSASDAAAGRPQRGGGGTVDAECRVCHDFTKGDETHLVGCDQCHISDAYLQVDVSAAPPRTRRPFPHAAHLESGELSCFSCHRTMVEEDWVEYSVPPPSLGPKGRDGRPGGPLGEEMCADCHAEHEPAGGTVEQDDVTGDGKRCGVCHMDAKSILPLAYRSDRPTSEVRPFRHEDHGGAAGTCDTCHGDIRESQTIWDYDPTLATAEACISCHIADAEGTPLVGVANPARTSKLPYVDFSKFPHAAHLAEPKGEIEVSGKVTADCRTCHYPETDPEASRLFPGRPPSGEPVGRAQLVDYRACEPCHMAWKCENHGVGAWACFKCHTGLPDAEGNLPIATTKVTRDEITSVQFDTVHHPGITSKGAPVKDMNEPNQKACGDCHVGDLDELSSRLADKGFAHEPHVSGDAANTECLVCHPTAATTTWSEDLQRFEARVGGVGSVVGAAADAKGCLECHVGGTPEELGMAQKDRVVPQFDHKAHVSAENYYAIVSGIACTECHVPGGETGYSIPQDVADCTKCHTHDETQKENYARTGPASSEGEAKLCLHCHDEVHADGEAPERKTRTRTHLDLLPGTQFHDLGGTCAECHERDPLDGARSDYQERITTARVKSSIHDDTNQRNAWFNDPRIKDAGVDPQGRTCMSCHRREPRGYLRSLVR